MLEHITPRYASHWKEIGVLIGIPIEEIKAIEHGHPTMPKVCCNEMLTKWLECDKNASWSKVFAAIYSPAISSSSVAFNDISEYFSCFISIKHYFKLKVHCTSMNLKRYQDTR